MDISISNITLDNVNIATSSNSNIVNFISTGSKDLTLNIIGYCSLDNTFSFGSCLYVSNNNCGFAINGDSSSQLSVAALDNVCPIKFDYMTSAKITGGISIYAKTHTYCAIYCGSNFGSLIFDTTGKVILDANNDYLGGSSAIYAMTNSFKLIVRNGFLELHSQHDLGKGCAAIFTRNQSTSDIVQLGSNFKMLGAETSDATLAQCTDVPYMKSFTYYDEVTVSLSCIGNAAAGTVFIYYAEPEPTPGDAYLTAQTDDSMPGAIIALVAVIALASFVVMRSRKFNF